MTWVVDRGLTPLRAFHSFHLELVATKLLVISIPQTRAEVLSKYKAIKLPFCGIRMLYFLNFKPVMTEYFDEFIT